MWTCYTHASHLYSRKTQTESNVHFHRLCSGPHKLYIICYEIEYICTQVCRIVSCPSWLFRNGRNADSSRLPMLQQGQPKVATNRWHQPQLQVVWLWKGTNTQQRCQHDIMKKVHIHKIMLIANTHSRICILTVLGKHAGLKAYLMNEKSARLQRDAARTRQCCCPCGCYHAMNWESAVPTALTGHLP